MRRTSSRPPAIALSVLSACTLSYILTAHAQHRVEGAGEVVRPAYPPARRVNKSDTYHGVEVTDPYR